MNFIMLNRDELQGDGNTSEFEGARYGEMDISVILVDMPPGGSVRLHQHPYKEVFIIQEGTATYTIGSTTLEARAGQIVIAPANVPHKFINSGQSQLRQVDIHLSKQFITQWLED